MPGVHDERVCIMDEIEGSEDKYFSVWSIPGELQVSLEKKNKGTEGSAVF